MLDASLYILVCSTRNRVRQRLRRLWQPRYFVGALATAGLLGLLVLRPAGRRGGGRQLRVQVIQALQASGSALLGVMLFVVTVFGWTIPFDGGLLDFSKAEADFLLPAPVRQRQLLLHGFLKAQPGLFLGATIPALFLPLGSPGARLRLALAGWLILMTGKVYATGVALSKARRAVRESGRLTSWLPSILMTAAVGIVLVPLVLEFSGQPAASVGDALERTGRIAGEGLPSLVLLPFSTLARPMFSTSTLELLWCLALAGIVTLAVVAWVLFEHEGIRDVAAAAGYQRPQSAGATGTRTAAWTLGTQGRPEAAIVWKGATEMRREVDGLGAAWLLIVLAVLAVAANLEAAWARGLSDILRVFAGVTLWFVLFIAPQSLKIDLRRDLQHVELLKTWPVSPMAMVCGQMLWPVAVLTVMAWVMTALLLALSPAAYPDVPWQARLSYATSAALLTPVFLWTQYTIRNAAVLAFPSWASVGAHHARGFDAIGHRMLTAVGTWLTLAVVLTPGLIAGVATWSRFNTSLGPAVWVAASLACALVVGAELLLASTGLATLYERLDPPAMEVSR